MNDFTSPAVQAMNLIRYIGDEVAKTGKPIDKLPDIRTEIGAPSDQFFYELVEELRDRGVIRTGNPIRASAAVLFMDVSLTLDGWERYESEQRGEFSGQFGFIAMKFGDEQLDKFVRETVKPAVKEGLGYELHDLRDVSRAGVIDNIMRVQIRDAKFVIADLTHDNSGAYWEAGYAEGLGKPVIYICEKAKFEDQASHFDTNHSTTVTWALGHEDTFRKELVATLRRTLDEFNGPETPQ